MIVIHALFTIIATLLVLLHTAFFVTVYCWIMLIPKYKRKKLFDIICTDAWTILTNIIVGVRLKVLGSENIDRKRTSLYICNHQSWLDVPLLAHRTHSMFVSKKEVRRLPIIGLLIIYSGMALLFDRKARSARLGIIKELMTVFKKKFSVTIFPEGTRSPDGSLAKPNTAVIKVCHKLKIPVVPVALEGTCDVVRKGRPYLKFGQKVIISFNPPIDPANYENADDFAEACWNKVVETHHNIRVEYFPHKLAN